jgi:hypothetical protein
MVVKGERPGIVEDGVDQRSQHHLKSEGNASCLGGLAKASSVWVKSQNGIRLDWEQARTISDFGAFLWVYGYFTYSNFMGEKSTIGYIARWDISKGFVREPLAQYEYKRKA